MPEHQHCRSSSGPRGPRPQPRARTRPGHGGRRDGGRPRVGRGDKNGADGAAVKAMRTLVSTVSMNGIVVIGEGEKDEAPMLYNGERVGDGTGAECRRGRRPGRRHTLTAKGMANAVAVLAVADRGTMFDPSAVFYMDKLVAGPEAADFVDITAPRRSTSAGSPRPRAAPSRTSR